MMKKIIAIALTLAYASTSVASYDPPRSLNSATDSVNVGNFPATQPVSATALPLPSGAATSAAQTTGNASLSAIDTKLGSTLNVNVLSSSSGGSTAAKQDTGNASLSSIDSKLSTSTVNPGSDSAGLVTRSVPIKKFRSSFSQVQSGVDTASFTLIQTGTGQTLNQTAGNLVITSGTTANAETILRSTQAFSDSLIAKWTNILSQRIANNNFVVELVDVIGDGLALTVNSATSITVTIPSNPFNSTSVGQAMYVGAISGVAGIPGRFVISSVSGNNVTFTVAGWPASGSGTVSLFGWNYCHAIYTGTSATAVNYDCARKGWASGETAATTNTSASPGHMGIMQMEDSVGGFFDQLVASGTSLQGVQRASRVQMIPYEGVNLFLQIRALNGTSNPATSTTWTIGLASIENFASQMVNISGSKVQAMNASMPVQVANVPAVTVSGTVTTSGTTNATLQASTNLSNDVGMQYRSNATGAALRVHLVTAASTNATIVKASAGRLIGYIAFNNSASWRYVKLYNIATSPVVGTTPVVQTIGLPPGQYVDFNCEGGMGFTTGIGAAVVAGPADADATAITGGDVIVDFLYQ